MVGATAGAMAGAGAERLVLARAVAWHRGAPGARTDFQETETV
ncbi:hypothetical protein [Pseudofrankia asymbiotica]|nr:hypothetical protein [Pseudofrankia asymbiotica]